PQHPVALAPGDTFRVGDVTITLQRAGVGPTTSSVARPTPDVPLELRLTEETARSARHGEPFVHARVHVAPAQADAAREILFDALRTSDVLAEDGPGRFQLLFPALTSERGFGVLQRLVGALGGHGIASRTGIAAYPVDGITAAQLSARARELTAMTSRDRSPMDHVRRLVASVARGDLTVLITGETGVGKELIAEMIHRASPRAQQPFVKVNCAAIAEPLLESELFGHARGAFTGADAARLGLIETAGGGTIFLDEIGEMGLRVQASLLRVIEERIVRRIGESEGRAVDVRIVCATNRTLAEEVEGGRFRRDLYYRIGGVTVDVPPLRDRPDEVECIARAFAALASGRTQQTVPVFTDEAIQALRTHRWPGNVRELRNTIERAVLLVGDGPIRPAELGLAPSAPPSVSDLSGEATMPPIRRSARVLSSELAELERHRIVEALEEFGGNQTRAARALGLSRTTLVARLEAYGLRRPRK
ncbi:MAG: sigma-54-dependent Fis family transcriptional regulator, partial [Myxococcales bacterium]|nr:sigma-54-dependent Fis family transcriptional regulator [Myxococcales bacterium]